MSGYCHNLGFLRDGNETWRKLPCSLLRSAALLVQLEDFELLPPKQRIICSGSPAPIGRIGWHWPVRVATSLALCNKISGKLGRKEAPKAFTTFIVPVSQAAEVTIVTGGVFFMTRTEVRVALDINVGRLTK